MNDSVLSEAVCYLPRSNAAYCHYLLVCILCMLKEWKTQNSKSSFGEWGYLEKG